MRAIVILNGQPPLKAMLDEYWQPSSVILCADGAANGLYRYHITPHVIMGDMDSIEPVALSYFAQNGVEIQRFQKEKDETDGQLIVDRAFTFDPDEIVMLGGLGRRLDHTLGNLQLLIRCAKKGIPAFAVSEREKVSVVLTAQTFSGKRGDTVSLIPLTSHTVVSTEGLQYGVQHFHFPLDTPIGISNMFLTNTAVVSVDSGMVAVIHNLCSC